MIFSLVLAGMSWMTRVDGSGQILDVWEIPRGSPRGVPLGDPIGAPWWYLWGLLVLVLPDPLVGCMSELTDACNAI